MEPLRPKETRAERSLDLAQRSFFQFRQMRMVIAELPREGSYDVDTEPRTLKVRGSFVPDDDG